MVEKNDDGMVSSSSRYIQGVSESDKMNAFFGYQVIEKVKFLSFDDSQSIFKKYKEKKIKTENYNDYKKINNIKKLIKLTNFLKKK